MSDPFVVKPCPVDDDGRRLNDRGTQFFVHSDTLSDSAFVPVYLARDCKEFAVIVTTGSLIFKGTQPGTRLNLAASAVVDAGGGIVTLTAGVNHGFTVGDTVEIIGTAHYDGSYVLQSGSTGASLNILATYVAETTAITAYVNGYRNITITNGTGPIPICKVAGDALFYGMGGGSANVTIQVWAWR